MIALIKAVPVWVWLGISLIAAIGVMYLRLDAARLEVTTVTTERDIAIARAESIANTMRLQRQLTADINKVSDDAKAKAENVTAAVVVADDRARSLQQRVTDLLASRKRCAAEVVSGSKARADLTDVLADLRRSADERAGSLAGALDRSRIAGFACESMYEAASKSK